MTQTALTHLNLLSCLNLTGAQQPGFCGCTSPARTAPCLGVSSVTRTFAGARDPWPLLFLPVLLLACHFLLISYPKGLLVWLVLPEATVGGLGFSHPTEGDKGGEEVQCIPHGHLVGHLHQLCTIPVTIICLCMYWYPAAGWKWGGSSKGTLVWRGCQSPQPPTLPAASAEQGDPTRSGSCLHNPAKYSNRGACNSSRAVSAMSWVDIGNCRCGIAD